MKKKKKGIQISDKVWLLISLLAALLLWYCLSLGAKTGRSFPFIDKVVPAVGYAPLIVIIFGVGQKPAVILIWICTFMTMSITIYQGIKNIDTTLIKAARVLGANDFDIFLKVICPATVPFIITAVRLGLSAALTTLLAAESTGAQAGIGMRIRSLANSFDSPPMLMYIILLGIIGLILVKIVDIIERKLTGWQEKI